MIAEHAVEAGPAGGGGVRVTPTELYENDDPRFEAAMAAQRPPAVGDGDDDLDGPGVVLALPPVLASAALRLAAAACACRRRLCLRPSTRWTRRT